MTIEFFIDSMGIVFNDCGITDDGGYSLSESEELVDKDGNWIKGLELMQFTGLLDKNGKEIYEGDILKFTQGFYKAKRNQNLWLPIIYDEKHAMFVCDGKSFTTPIDTTGEIIGNIWEHPNLLKG